MTDNRIPGFVYSDGYNLDLAERSVGPGWHKLLAPVFRDKPEDVNIVQVKEKFGELRIYYDNAEKHDAFGRIVRAAEDVSSRTCEDCGDSGTRGLSKKRWLKTQCQACVDKETEL